MSRKFIIKSASDRPWSNPNPLDKTPLEDKVKRSSVKNIELDCHESVWVVEVESLESILTIMNVSGHELIIKQQDEYELPTIVIYDDYNE